MKSLIEKATGKVICSCPDEIDMVPAGTSEETHEWVSDIPETDVREAIHYRKTGKGQYVKAEKVDEKKAFEDAIVAKVEARLEAKIKPK